MTFIDAIQHATIGYRVARTTWRSVEFNEKTAIALFLNQDRRLQWVPGNVANGCEVGLCPSNYNPADGVDLGPEDINADDWEIVRCG